MLKKYILQVILIVLVVSKTGYCQYYELPQTSAKDHVFKYSAYTVLYNTTTNTPRWVAWTFSTNKRSNIKVARSGNKFLPDPNLGSASPTHDTYTNSGYDRGHMCPANDCLWSGKALEESFYMSNICPQTAELNRAKGRKGLGSPWRIVEEKCDGPWADHYKMLYIVAGPIPNEIRGTIPIEEGRSILVVERGDTVRRGTILIEEGRSILVPKRFFKAIVGVDKNGKYHGIGFIFTQECAVQIVSIDEVERQACLDLFYQIPQRIQNKIEKVSSFSESDWPDLSVIK